MVFLLSFPGFCVGGVGLGCGCGEEGEEGEEDERGDGLEGG